MKNKKGFTLLEVVIATAILGMVAVVVLSCFSLQFKTIVSTRYITKDVFAAQQTIENKITGIKDAIQNDLEPEGGDRTAYTIFAGKDYQRTVYGFPRTIDVGTSGARLFFTVVADNKMPEFAVASATVDIDFSDDTLIAVDNAKSSLYVESHPHLVDPDNVNMTNIYRWYVSRPGFNIPMIAAPEEIEKGNKYPNFPGDYGILGYIGSNMTADLSDYAGRFLVCTVTPAAKSGKMGETAISNTVFVPGLTVTSGLKLHLDASLVSKDDSAAVSKSGSDYYVKSCQDISGNNRPAAQTSSGSRPMLYEEKTGDFAYNDGIYQTWVKYMSFDGSNDVLYTPTLGTDNTTVFVVARDGGDTKFTIYNNIDSPWDIYDPAILSYGGGRVYLGYDYIGATYSACDVAEVIIYNRGLSNAEMNDVEDYLAAKYTPVPPAVSIASLQSIVTSILKGQAFTMPSTVIAYMTDGTTRNVAVSWTPAAVNSNQLGLQEFIGTVSGTTKTAALKVTVIDATIEWLENITVTVEQNTPYTMPSSALAHLSDHSTMNVPVAWSPSSISTATLGAKYSTGTSVFDNSKSMLLTVNVVEKLATGITLNKNSLALTLPDSETLIATVTPADAANKSVGWSSSNSGVATVDSNGTVTSVGAGTAIITARTMDGSNLSATCAVTVSAISLTGIGAISGTMQVGQTITAGALTPAGATATYQWLSASSLNGTYTAIAGATGSTYTLTGNEYNYYIKVRATGSGSYTGTATSAARGPVTSCALISIGNISGTPQVGQTLTAGAVLPAGATVTYQWQRNDGTNGAYRNITNATGSTYTLTSASAGYNIRVRATGSGGYTGTVTSNAVGPVTTPLISISAITGTMQVGQTITAGSLTPSGATATYQWQRNDGAGGTYINIGGATAAAYTLTGNDYSYNIRVVATGSGNYSGSVTSAARGPVTSTALVSIGNISGTVQVGHTLTAGALTPAGATATYQWQSASSAGGTYTNIGATGSTYNLVSGDFGRYIRVVATGSGGYTGTVTSNVVGPVTTPLTAIGAISGTMQVGQTITAGSLTPSGATATYQWQRNDGAGGTYINIGGATAAAYTLTGNDYSYNIRVVATGSGNYSGSVTSAARGPVTACPITYIAGIGGTARVGQTLTAGAVTPAGATVDYQWLSAATYGGNYTTIPGSTDNNTYTLAASDFGRYIKVSAIGNGGYTGTETSAAIGAVTACPINISAITGVTVPVTGATPVTTITATAQYTGTVSWSPALSGSGRFVRGTIYTATITITAKSGYTLTGVAANFFTVAGATTVTNPANSGTVTAIFPRTAW